MRESLRSVLFLALLSTSVKSAPVTLDFEDLNDSTVIGNAYVAMGVGFSGALAVKAGFTLFEQEFPPHSGLVAVLDDFIPIELMFVNPISSFSAYFTYTLPLQLSAYNSANALVATAASSANNNTALSGDVGTLPNEQLQLSSASGISRIIITGAVNGNSFVMDDVTFDTTAIIPEPATSVVGAALILLIWGKLCRSARR